MKKINVDLNGNSYPIYIGENLLSNSDILEKHIKSRQILFVSNETVASLYLPVIKKNFLDYLCDELILPDGEIHKTLGSYEKIIDHLINNKHHRDTTLIAVGGGVIGDITGFAAATYQRGVRYLQIPTTLLAQVDASIGGKTAVNRPQGKNLIGAFYQPSAVIIDINTLNTLPEREFKSGLAEIIKAALIHDASFFELIENKIVDFLHRDPNTIVQFIQRACEIKRNIVMADENETTGERALLNLGHTFGHAIEHELGYGQYLHGEAIAVGLVLAAKLSLQQGCLSDSDVTRIENLLNKTGLPIKLPQPLTIGSLLNAMRMDKKVENQTWRFVLLKRIGFAFLATQITEKDLKSLIN